MSEAFNEALVIEAFSDFIRASGITPKNTLTIIPDGQLHRFAVEGDKFGATNGAYVLHLNGSCPAGYVQDWKRGISTNWKYNFSPEERRAYGRRQHDPEERAKHETARREAEKAKAEELKRQNEKQQAARQMALKEYLAASNDFWKQAYIKSRFSDRGICIIDRGQFAFRYAEYQHEGQTFYDYSQIIQFPLRLCTETITGGICREGELLVPFINPETGSFQTIQRISATPNSQGKFEKRFYPNATPKAAAHALLPEHSEAANTVFSCEGIATALALCVDLRGLFPVFSTGSCGNLFPVCEKLRKRYSKAKLIVVADNDSSGAGMAAATKCKNAGLVDGIRMPEIAGHDWYDRLILKLKKGI